MKKEMIKELIGKMTLEEKAGMCSGADFWHTKAVERLGIPETMVSDGPHGLRKNDTTSEGAGVNDSIKAVCFPAGCGTAASFNRELLVTLGEALGDSCQAEGVSVILGPAVNIKRSPLCGRNFEYYSEDPYLAGEIAANHIAGVQSKHVGTSIKHFLANNQETRRMSCDVIADDRTLREIYLTAFERAVKQSKPWTVMCSYNKINGVYAAENQKYLTEILRNEWGFDGYVMSDWGAVNDRTLGLKAGLELEMPHSFEVNDKLIVKAVKEGRLEEEVLNTAVERILNIVYKFVENRKEDATFDREEQHKLARKIAQETIVLLKNDAILPLKKEDKIAFIGEFVKKPRYQGGGSSHINSFRTSSAYEQIEQLSNITFAQGYVTENDNVDETLIAEAVSVAKASNIAVIFAGLPDAYESEGFDRSHMKMPENQNRLIREICKVQPNTVVVLHNGSPVEMPWIHDVKAVVETYLAGQAVGEATCDILFGDVNPSAKLAETFPVKLADNPSYLNFPGEEDRVEYKEGIFVGYRYYDKKELDVLFPFGHGLSYTNFEYSNLILQKEQVKDNEEVVVTVDVKNIGAIAGKEVVQLYISDLESTVIRPVKELKEFAKINLEAGETKTVTFHLDQRAFAYFNTQINDWHVESGTFDIQIGKSSRDIVLSKTIFVESTVELPKKYHMNTTIGDINKDPFAKQFLKPVLDACTMLDVNCTQGEGLGSAADEMNQSMMNFLPLRAVLSFCDGTINHDDIQAAVDKMNQIR